MEQKPRLHVWIASLPDAKQGLSFRQDAEAALRFSKKRKLVLNHEAAELLEMRALKSQGAWPSSESVEANSVLGWAIVEPQSVCHHLQHLTPSQRIQRKFWHSVGPGDEQSIYFFKIVEMHSLIAPVKLGEWSCLQNHAFFSVLDDVACNLLERALQEQFAAGQAHERNNQCCPIDVVRLPLCFASMLCSNTWDSFAVCDMAMSSKKVGRGGWHLGLRQDMREGFGEIPWRANPEELANFSIQEPENAEAFLDEIRYVVCSLQSREPVDLQRLYFFLTAGFARFAQVWEACSESGVWFDIPYQMFSVEPILEIRVAAENCFAQCRRSPSAKASLPHHASSAGHELQFCSCTKHYQQSKGSH